MSLFRYITIRVAVSVVVLSMIFTLLAMLYTYSKIEEEKGRVMEMTRTIIETALNSHMMALSNFEVFFEEALEKLFEKVRENPESLEELLEDFKPRLLEEDIKLMDWAVVDLNGHVLKGGKSIKPDIDPYTASRLKELGVGDHVFERLGDVLTIGGEGYLVKRGYLRLDENSFLVVSIVLSWENVREVYGFVADLPKKFEMIDRVGIYTYSLEPCGGFFPPLKGRFRDLVRKAFEKMEPVIEEGKNEVFIVFPEIFEDDDERFSKPMAFLMVIDISRLKEWKRNIELTFFGMMAGLVVLIILSVHGITRKISSQFEKLIHAMEKFKKEREFFVPDETVSSPINEIRDLVAHFYDMAQELTAHMEELTALNEELERSYSELERAHKELEEAHLLFSKQLAVVAEGYDENTGNHIVRVGELSAFLAEKLELGPDFVERIRHYAPLHDIGKLLVPKDILSKKGRLTDEEFEVMKKHTIYGAILLEDIPRFEMARKIALYHHEKYDGTGYPFGLRGDEIPIEAQIVSIVDVYDALRSERPYKRAFSHEEAMRIILEGDGRTSPSNFNPRILEIFKEFSKEIEELWDRVKEQGGLLDEKMKRIARYMVYH